MGPRVLATIALLMFAAPAHADFGAGAPTFQEYVVEGIDEAPEPTIGIPWNTDHVFYHGGSTTMRGAFDDNGTATWVDVTPPYQVPINLDPLLIADEDTGRILAGGLHGACSVMMISDDDGATWIPSGNMCSGAQFDHQSVGLGPKPGVGNPVGAPQLLNGYYCGQLGLIGCSVSLDGGETWTVPTPAAIANLQGGCAGFHGHWRVSDVTGTAFLPVPACGSQHGMLVPNANGLQGTELAGLSGLTFEARLVEGSHAWDGGFDPSIGIGRGEGWVYYGQADHMGARLALSKDEGRTWEALPDPQNNSTTWLDVGQFHDPPVVLATFADVQAGDDDRAAFTFLGLLDLDGDGTGSEYGGAPRALYECDPQSEDGEENREWHYFAAFTYDAGQTWDVVQVTDHPVQVGGIWDRGGGDPCRNLLDFNDMDIDSKGRVHIAWADGCIGDCLEEEPRYSREPRLFRQTGGKGLFAAFDGNETPEPTPTATPTVEPDEDSPAPALLAIVSALGAAVLLARRR